MGANTRGRTCEHDRGYYGYVDSSTGDCPYCKLRAVEAENKRIRDAAQAVVGDYGVVSSIATAGSTALMDELRRSLESGN